MLPGGTFAFYPGRGESDQVDEIFEQREADRPALFRVELDAVHVVADNCRGKGKDVFRGGERVLRGGIGIVGMDKVYIRFPGETGKKRALLFCKIYCVPPHVRYLDAG